MIRCIFAIHCILIYCNPCKWTQHRDARNRNAWAMTYGYKERICRILTRTRESWVHFATSWLKLGKLPINVSLQRSKTVASIAQNCNDIKQDTWCNQNTSQIIPVHHLWGSVTQDFPERSCLIVSRSLNLACRRFRGVFLVYIEVRYMTPSDSLFTYIMRSNYCGVSSFVEYLVYHHHVINIIHTNDDTVSIKWTLSTF